ncbi:OFA family MFS transporter [Petroclostridium sp. X23]|uniref:L-lactate MFS transporter n=1 Tax=Petroclostridium sp. X23 TaxID=3045146 RepID=UPI0024AE00EC|nr:OFA family MFS transporter [Petroclostridium sp. X23]WHH60125.1 OFA family MFS transporter [Petroclostridium sp. X23]
MPPVKGRWLFVILGMLMFICLGTIYSWSIFRKPLEQLFNIGATQSGLPYMVFLVMYAGVMPFAGIMLEKHGPSKVIVGAGILVGLGWYLSGYTSNILAMVFTYGVIAGGGVGASYGAVIATISKWFPDKKGFATGLTLLGFGLSPFVTAPLARWLLDFCGLLETMKILGIMFLFIIILTALPFKFPQESFVSKMGFVDGSIAIPDIETKQMFKDSRYYALWICFSIGTFNGLMAVSIAGPVGEEMVALGPDSTAVMISLFAIFNGVGRPLFGWLTDVQGPVKTSLASFVIIILSAILLVGMKENATILYGITFSLLWLVLGGWLAIAPAATAEFFGQKYYTKNYGFVFTAYGVGAMGGALISGELRDIFGTYIYVFYPMMISACLGIIIAFFFLRTVKK